MRNERGRGIRGALVGGAGADARKDRNAREVKEVGA